MVDEVKYIDGQDSDEVEYNVDQDGDVVEYNVGWNYDIGEFINNNNKTRYEKGGGDTMPLYPTCPV